MLTKMIYKNIDKKNMLLYSFSLILSVALEMFFGAAFIANDQYGLNEKNGNMSWLCTAFFLIAGIMSIFFTLYATIYYVRTKNKDYSLLLMLGSSRKFIFRFFSIEFLLIYIFSVVSGILAGGISSALLLWLLGFLQYPVTFALSDILQVIKIVIKINFSLFLLELLLILLYFCKRNLADMQLRGIKKERKHERTCFLAIAGVCLIAYAMKLLKESNLLYHFISMPICLIGIYIIMSFGGSLILMLLKLFQKFYYAHLITLNEFYYRFKSNCRLLFIMLVLDFVIVFFSGASVISQIPENVDSPEYPYGFVGVMQDSGQRDAIEEILGSDRIELAAIMGYLSKEDIGLEEKGYFCVSDREYSQLTSHSLHLEDGEAVWVNETTVLDTEKPDILYLSEEETLSIAEIRNEIVFGTEKPDCLHEFVILPESVVTNYRDNGYHIIVKGGDLQEEFEQYRDCSSGEDANFFWRYAFLKDANENMVFVKIVSIFTGIFCLLSCFGIFALKMQSDLPFLNQKYKILYHIGMSERSIDKAMSSEYRKILAIPVVMSVLLSSIYMIAEMTDRDMFLRYYICKYIPFQIIFVCLHILFFCWIKKFVLQRNTICIINK